MVACCRIDNYDEYLIRSFEAVGIGVRVVKAAFSNPLHM